MSTVPPLLQLSVGKKVRARCAPVVTPKELTLHMAVAALLRDHCLPQWDWTHFPSGEERKKRTAGKLKQMGLRPGWPDFILLAPDDRLYCLELKRHGAKLSDIQREFSIRREIRGTPYEVCKTIDDVFNVFDRWGCLRITVLRRRVAERGAGLP